MTATEVDALIIKEPFDLVLLAEMYADLGDPREEAVRWIIAEGKWPVRAAYKRYGFFLCTERSRMRGTDDLPIISDYRQSQWFHEDDANEAIRRAISEYMKHRSQ